MVAVSCNSFFDQNYNGLKVMVIVPHQDDEINAAAAMTYTLSRAGANIVLVYTTNGDWKYTAETRMKEAVNAAGVLGVKEENIIFLGYGDAFNNDMHDHLFYHAEKVRSASGYEETYGSRAHLDYVFKKTGKHHEYTNINYLDDIVEVVGDYRPDLILCIDFDEHPDHRMLSLYFDRAIGILRKNDATYTPEVWKRFAYSTGYTAVADYSVINNPETQRPEVGITGKYEWDLIDTLIYRWSDRIRIPVPEEMRTSDLKKNLLATALNQHKSQYIITRADRIINSDEVYWSRRTDSIAYSAEITVSSGDGHFLNDFMIYDTDDVDSLVPDLSGHSWRPDVADKDKRAILRWQLPQHIEKIVIYGEITDKGAIEELKIRLSDGYEKTVHDIPTNGNPVFIDTGVHERITECVFEVIKSGGAGLTEVEVYSKKDKESHIRPYAKILVDDNFAYEYLAGEDFRTLKVGLYRYGGATAEIAVAEGSSKIVGDELHVDPEDNEVVLQAVSEDGKVLDQTVINRKTQDEIAALKAIEKNNKAYLTSMRKKMKVHNMLYILRHAGIGAVVKRTVQNVIRPFLMRK